MAAAAKAKVLRSVFLDPEMDEILRLAAFRLKVSKGELIRSYVERGINAERQAAQDEHAAAIRAEAAQTTRDNARQRVITSRLDAPQAQRKAVAA